MRRKLDKRAVAFGSAVRALRKSRGFSQETLADLAGLHRTYVGGVERGERNISLINMHAIAAALDTPVSALMRIAEKLDASSAERR